MNQDYDDFIHLEEISSKLTKLDVFSEFIILDELYEKIVNILIEEEIHWNFEDDNMFVKRRRKIRNILHKNFLINNSLDNNYLSAFYPFEIGLYRPRKPFLITSYLLSIAAPKILTSYKSRLFYGSRNILTENIRLPFFVTIPMNRQQREKRHKTYLYWLLRKYQRQFEKKIIIKAKDLEISLIPED